MTLISPHFGADSTRPRSNSPSGSHESLMATIEEQDAYHLARSRSTSNASARQLPAPPVPARPTQHFDQFVSVPATSVSAPPLGRSVREQGRILLSSSGTNTPLDNTLISQPRVNVREMGRNLLPQPSRTLSGTDTQSHLPVVPEEEISRRTTPAEDMSELINFVEGTHLSSSPPVQPQDFASRQRRTIIDHAALENHLEGQAQQWFTYVPPQTTSAPPLGNAQRHNSQLYPAFFASPESTVPIQASFSPTLPGDDQRHQQASIPVPAEQARVAPIPQATVPLETLAPIQATVAPSVRFNPEALAESSQTAAQRDAFARELHHRIDPIAATESMFDAHRVDRGGRTRSINNPPNLQPRLQPAPGRAPSNATNALPRELRGNYVERDPHRQGHYRGRLRSELSDHANLLLDIVAAGRGLPTGYSLARFNSYLSLSNADAVRRRAVDTRFDGFLTWLQNNNPNRPLSQKILQALTLKK